MKRKTGLGITLGLLLCCPILLGCEKEKKEKVVIFEGHVGVQIINPAEGKPGSEFMKHSASEFMNTYTYVFEEGEYILQKTLPPGEYFIEPSKKRILLMDTRIQEYKFGK